MPDTEARAPTLLRTGVYVHLVDTTNSHIGEGVVLEQIRLRGTQIFRIQFLGSLHIPENDPRKRRLEKESCYCHPCGCVFVLENILDDPAPIVRVLIDNTRRPAC